ncbi:MAG: glycosyltransferase [Flavobacteriales bacterium]|nr:glycosyltransferase [Flavobacteriales bacterium]
MVGTRALRSAKKVVAISQALKNDLGRFGVPADRIDVVPNGVFRASTYASLASATGAPISRRSLFPDRVDATRARGKWKPCGHWHLCASNDPKPA